MVQQTVVSSQRSAKTVMKYGVMSGASGEPHFRICEPARSTKHLVFASDSGPVKLLIDGFGRDLPGSIRSEKVIIGEKATRSKPCDEIAIVEGQSK